MRMPRHGHCLLPTIVASALLTTAAACLAGGWQAGYVRIGETDVPLTGRETALPLPRDVKPGEIRVVLSGEFTCAYNGQSYDPVWATGASEAFDQEHDYVRWRPGELRVVEGAPSGHEYVLVFPDNVRQLPEAVSVWIDVDQFVADFIEPPSDVRRSLSGNLRLEVWRAKRTGSAASLAVLGLVAITALAIVIARRRKSPCVDMSDVRELLARIDRKYDSAVGTIEGQREDTVELRGELERLRDGSRELAKHIEAFRGAARTVDRRQLDGEIATIEKRLDEVDRDDVRREIEATLAAKRRLRDLLADSDASEARYLLRLSKIESAIDATTMRVTSQGQRLADDVREDRAISELEGELESLDEAIEELKLLD